MNLYKAQITHMAYKEGTGDKEREYENIYIAGSSYGHAANAAESWALDKELDIVGIDVDNVDYPFIQAAIEITET